jgi:hypothetical protein
MFGQQANCSTRKVIRKCLWLASASQLAKRRAQRNRQAMELHMFYVKQIRRTRA